jgi:hypothetical protein
VVNASGPPRIECQRIKYIRYVRLCPVLENFYALGENRLLFLSAGPYRMKSTGIGIINTATHPNNVLAQRGSNALYICDANSGNVAPNSERTMVLAERAEAASNR